ncbi:histone deacetylase 5, partial [Tanacetum coccineum]
AGSVLEVDEILAKGKLYSAFAIVKPPGHHAEKHEPMRFCVYNQLVCLRRCFNLPIQTADMIYLKEKLAVLNKEAKSLLFFVSLADKEHISMKVNYVDDGPQEINYVYSLMVGCFEVVDEVQIHVHTFGYASEELATDDCVEIQL